MKIKDILGPPASPEQIEAFERRHGIRLPNDYRHFLSCHNGGRPDKAFRVFTFETKSGSRSDSLVDWFSGLVVRDNYSLDNDLDTYSGRIPEGMLPIARDPFGNLILLGVQDSKSGIWFWDHEIEPTDIQQSGIYKVSDNFELFVKSLAPIAM